MKWRVEFKMFVLFHWKFSWEIRCDRKLSCQFGWFRFPFILAAQMPAKPVSRSNHMTLQLSIVVHTQIWLRQVVKTETSAIWTRRNYHKPHCGGRKLITIFMCGCLRAPVYTLHFFLASIPSKKQWTMMSFAFFLLLVLYHPPAIFLLEMLWFFFTSHAVQTTSIWRLKTLVLPSHLPHIHSNVFFCRFLPSFFQRKTFCFPLGQMFFFNRSWSLQVIKFENNLRNDVRFFLRSIRFILTFFHFLCCMRWMQHLVKLDLFSVRRLHEDRKKKTSDQQQAHTKRNEKCNFLK